METERWSRIEELYLAALNVKEDERPLFLGESCGQDDELRQEIESLLSYEKDTDDVIESTALAVAAEFLAECKGEPRQASEVQHADLVGKTVAHYRILEKLGAGGMGVVYKAEDMKLGRFVALKFLPNATLGRFEESPLPSTPPQDPRALERFEREARASSALDHPNICIVHEVGEQEGSPYIVMQFLSGQTLKQSIGGKAVATDRILDLGVQISDALDAAHSAGIIHRDIKPANVFVTQRDQVKILDFGLATFTTSQPLASLAEPIQWDSPVAQTCDDTLLRPGIALGTASYMSPQQILGGEIDARSDLFSLGVVLYEMATGTLPFQGETVAAVFDNILHQKPVPLSVVTHGIPKELERIIGKAMEKLPEMRYQTAGELRDELKRLRTKKGSIGRALSPAVVLGILFLVLAVAVGYFDSRERTTSVLENQNTVVLGDFNNATNEATLDQTLKQALRAQLEQSPFLNMLSEERARQALDDMGLWRDTQLIGAVAREVCLRAGGNVAIEGSISTLGSHYVVGLQAINCQTGKAIGNEQAEAGGLEKILRSLGDATTRLRGRLGESPASIQKYDMPVEGTTTASLDALEAYSLATKILHVPGGSIPLLKHAIELDPNFAMAYARLGNEYFNFNQPGLGSAAMTKAYELRERVSEREKLYIESHYYGDVMGQIDKASEVYQLWQKTYPRDLIPHINLMGLYSDFGQHDRSVLEGQEALRLNTDEPMVYVNLGTAYMDLNQFDKAAEVLNDARAHKVDDALFSLLRYQLAFVKDDQEEMERQVAAAAGRSGMEGWLLALQADTEAYHGRLAKARAFTRRAIESARHYGDEETARSYAAIGALRETEFGIRGSVIPQLTAALEHERGQQVLVLGTLALARAGTGQKALAMGRNLNQQFPKDTLLNEYWLPIIRAAVELGGDDASRAIASLEPAARYELAEPRVPTYVLLYPIYLRGSAYLAAGLADKARAEFQKILDHPGLTRNYLLGAVAHLGLGRAYALEARMPAMPGVRNASRAEYDGRRALEPSDALAKSRAAYQDFFALWKGADPDVPLLVQARKEYRELR